MAILTGVRIVEFESIGPAPFCGMTLADMGAEVIVVERPGDAHLPMGDLGKADILRRGKKSIGLDLKRLAAREIVFDLVGSADGIIEGLRPGVMERLGLGPLDFRQKCPRLVYGRATGWGQDGVLSQAAAHDINYIGLSGALAMAGHEGEAPFAPVTLIGDVGGGALYLTIGMLAAIMSARKTGRGNVVDAAIVDGSAHMMNLALSFVASGQASLKRGTSFLGGAPWFDSYRCSCDNYITIGSLEERFFRLLLEKLGLADHHAFHRQHDRLSWPDQRAIFVGKFAERSRTEWQTLLEGTDVCFAPVLNAHEASCHPHMQARRSYYQDGMILQGAPAPRFQRGWNEKGGAVPRRGADTHGLLTQLGRTQTQIEDLRAQGVIQ